MSLNRVLCSLPNPLLRAHRKLLPAHQDNKILRLNPNFPLKLPIRALTAAAAGSKVEMVKAIKVYELGGPEVLKWEDVEIGEPKEGEIRVKHKAIGVNFIDVYFRKGVYKADLPFTPGEVDNIWKMKSELLGESRMLPRVITRIGSIVLVEVNFDKKLKKGSENEYLIFE